jgi:hypothetical protein
MARVRAERGNGSRSVFSFWNVHAIRVPLSKDDLRDIEEGKKAIAEGKVKSWEQVKSEYGL